MHQENCKPLLQFSFTNGAFVDSVSKHVRNKILRFERVYDPLAKICLPTGERIFRRSTVAHT